MINNGKVEGLRTRCRPGSDRHQQRKQKNWARFPRTSLQPSWKAPLKPTRPHPFLSPLKYCCTKFISIDPKNWSSLNILYNHNFTDLTSPLLKSLPQKHPLFFHLSFPPDHIKHALPPSVTRQGFQRRDGDTNPATKPSTHTCPACEMYWAVVAQSCGSGQPMTGLSSGPSLKTEPIPTLQLQDGQELEVGWLRDSG